MDRTVQHPVSTDVQCVVAQCEACAEGLLQGRQPLSRSSQSQATCSRIQMQHTTSIPTMPAQTYPAQTGLHLQGSFRSPAIRFCMTLFNFAGKRPDATTAAASTRHTDVCKYCSSSCRQHRRQQQQHNTTSFPAICPAVGKRKSTSP
jgi:hypothetical protein